MTTQTDNSSKSLNSRPDDESGDSENEESGLRKTTQGEAMAEETQTASPAKKASKKGHSSKKKAAKRAAPKAAAKKAAARPATEALATEQPVPTTPLKKTSQFVLTIDNQTGLPVKIEKLDDATGKPKELTGDEYGQTLAFAAGLPPVPAGGAESFAEASSAETDTLVKAYYQGITDYINALTSTR